MNNVHIMLPVATDNHVALCVRLPVCRAAALCKNGLTDRGPAWDGESRGWGYKAHCIRRRPRLPYVRGECGIIMPAVKYKNIARIRCGLRLATLVSCCYWGVCLIRTLFSLSLQHLLCYNVISLFARINPCLCRRNATRLNWTELRVQFSFMTVTQQYVVSWRRQHEPLSDKSALKHNSAEEHSLSLALTSGTVCHQRD